MKELKEDNDLKEFLAKNDWKIDNATRLDGDASFRVYYRLTKDNTTAILMDARNSEENIEDFIIVSDMLRNANINSPKIYSKDIENKLLIIEDFGSGRLQELLADPENKEKQAMHLRAVDALSELQKINIGGSHLQPMTTNNLVKEALLLLDWYIPILQGQEIRENQRKKFIEICKDLITKIPDLGQTIVLRDYHSPNLMWLKNKEIGVLDFQDAVMGSPAYDVVSLVQDARVMISANTQQIMVNRYLTNFPNIDRKKFLSAFHIFGALRNCKILGVFTRKAERDGNSSYLKYIPNVLKYLESNLAHPLVLPLQAWFEEVSEPGLYSNGSFGIGEFGHNNTKLGA